MAIDRLIDTHQLQCFVILAESESFSDAAGRMGLTQSAVSQCLKSLEALFGTELVLRRTRPLRLTHAGSALKRAADPLINDMKRLNVSVREAAEKGVRQCRLGLITSLSEVFGSPLIVKLEDRVKRLNLRSGLTTALVGAFQRREIDILISNDPLADMEGLERFTLLKDPMLVAIGSHLAPQANFNLQNLSDSLPMIKYGRESHIGIYSEVILRRMSILAQTRYETDDTHTMLNFVRDGHGWAILSALCLAQSRHHLEGISVLPLDNSKFSRTLHLVARKGEFGSIPSYIAQVIQSIFYESIHPNVLAAAPWLVSTLFDPDAE
ncbi:LysR family transcriptional regulator [Alcaligenes nematophilus]|uniref:LysR family transcriptional regulator n=1 Tax=Alcaligenes nematophilus TaxID=2994643 RepID=UPI0024637E5D|nr:LysR family transcriptional regulator [Alcaligenes nematophilus]MDH4865422.1 LysR family transcriptional regulator [Bacillus cereus]MDY7126721.1 LysR family transcriptional regulator [Alcaligenes nematophilus]